MAAFERHDDLIDFGKMQVTKLTNTNVDVK